MSARLLRVLLILFGGGGFFIWSCGKLLPHSINPANLFHYPHSVASSALIGRQQQQQQQPQGTTNTSEDHDDAEPHGCKLLCLVLSQNTEDNQAKSRAIRDTWGRRCNRLIFVTNGTRLALLANKSYLRLTVPIGDESRDKLWPKVREAFAYVYEHYGHRCDWFLKADDDTYVIVENLNSFLSNYSSREPLYFGHRFNKFARQGYMSGGSGYVLSRTALRSLVELGVGGNLSACMRGQVEDVQMGICLEAVQVRAGDSRDSSGRPRFVPLPPQDIISWTSGASQLDWYAEYEFYPPAKVGRDFCSLEAISFHYVGPKWMRFIDWLIYDLKRPPSQLTSGGGR